MDNNKEWQDLWAKKSEFDRALASKQILLSEWFEAVDSILHRLMPSLNEATHKITVDDIREREQHPSPRLAGCDRVLVVRRFRDTQQHTQSMLEAIGCEVTTAGDGFEAVVELALGHYDLLVIGSVLSHLSGVEVINLKNLLRIDTPAIMHTLMPLGLAAGLAFEVPLPPEDCICAGNIVDGKLSLNLRHIIEGDHRLLARVRAHLELRGKHLSEAKQGA